MHSEEQLLATQLDELAATLTAALGRVQKLAADRGHVIHREAEALEQLASQGPELANTLRAVAQQLESAMCEAVAFPNRRCGIETVVRPAVSGFAVVVRDLDAGRTLPITHRFSRREDAIAKAKHLAGTHFAPALRCA